MNSLDLLYFIIGMFLIWGGAKLYEEYLWFRVITATLGIGLTLLVPIGSTYLAYISFFEENSKWLAIAQITLGWSFLAIAFWYSIGTYLKFMKKTFRKSESSASSNKTDSEIKSNIKFSEKGKKWINDIKEDENLNHEERRKRILFGLLSRERFHEPRTVPLYKNKDDIVSIGTVKDFNGMKISIGTLKDGSEHVVVFNEKLKKWVKSKSVDMYDVLRSPPWIDDEDINV